MWRGKVYAGWAIDELSGDTKPSLTNAMQSGDPAQMLKALTGIK